MPSLEQTHPPAEHNSGIGRQFFGQVRLIEPDRPQVTRLVPHDSFGTPPPPQHRHLGLPHVSDYGLLVPFTKFGNSLPPTVIKVPVREKIEQVADGLHAHLVEFSCQSGADSPHHRYRRADAVSPHRRYRQTGRRRLLLDCCPAGFHRRPGLVFTAVFYLR